MRVRENMFGIACLVLLSSCDSSNSTNNNVEPVPTETSSSTDFSDTQGGSGWFYGYSAPFDTANFIEFGLYEPAVWHGTQTMNTPYLDATTGHPGIDDGAWSIRRWKSHLNGTVSIVGSFRDLDVSCGDGVNVRVLSNGVEQYVYQTIPDFSVVYNLELGVVVDDVLDFVIDPGLDTGCDATEFLITVNFP